MADFWPKNAISLNPHCHQGNKETMAQIQVWYNAVYLQVEATPALYFCRLISCSAIERNVSCTMLLLHFSSGWRLAQLLTNDLLRWFFNQQNVVSGFRASRTRPNTCWPLTQPGRLQRSFPSYLPAVTHLWVTLKGPACTGTFHPQQGGRFIIGWDCCWEPPIPPYPPHLSAVRTTERERARSARQLQRPNPRWARSLSLPCSWKTPPFEMGCIFMAGGWLRENLFLTKFCCLKGTTTSQKKK